MITVAGETYSAFILSKRSILFALYNFFVQKMACSDVLKSYFFILILFLYFFCSDVPAAAVDLIASRRNRCRPLLQNAPSLFLSQLLHCPSSAKVLNMKKTVQGCLVVDHLNQ